MTEDKNQETQEENSEELFEHFRFVADPKLKLLRVDKFLTIANNIPSGDSLEIEFKTPVKTIMS